MRILMLFSLVLSFLLIHAKEENCQMLDAGKLHLGMTYGVFAELSDVETLQMVKVKSEKLVVFDEYLLHSSELIQKSYSFYLPEWMLENVVPSDARLQSIEMQYDKEYDIRSVLMSVFGAPLEQRMPDAGIFFPFDARWKCKTSTGQTLQITLNHKRVLYELQD